MLERISFEREMSALRAAKPRPAQLRNQFGNIRPYQPTTGSILPWAVERDIAGRLVGGSPRS
jgi:hypothetical protein